MVVQDATTEVYYYYVLSLTEFVWVPKVNNPVYLLNAKYTGPPQLS